MFSAQMNVFQIVYVTHHFANEAFLNSERIDECINFPMIFFSVFRHLESQ